MDYTIRPVDSLPRSPGSFSLESHPELQTRLLDPDREGDGRPNKHHDAREHFQSRPATNGTLEDSTRNGGGGQSADGPGQEAQAITVAQLLERRDGRHQRGHERDVSPRGHTEQHRERDEHGVGAAGDPHGQHQDAGDGAGAAEDVETAGFVG